MKIKLLGAVIGFAIIPTLKIISYLAGRYVSEVLLFILMVMLTVAGILIGGIIAEHTKTK